MRDFWKLIYFSLTAPHGGCEETEPDPDMNTNPFLTNPVVAFVRRNLWLAAFLSGAVFLALNEWAYQKVGGLAYFPALILSVAVGVRFVRHMMSGKTTVAYTDNLVTEVKAGLADVEGVVGKAKAKVGNYVEDFHSLPAVHKVWITRIEIWVLIIAFAIIVAHVWK